MRHGAITLNSTYRTRRLIILENNHIVLGNNDPDSGGILYLNILRAEGNTFVLAFK